MVAKELLDLDLVRGEKARRSFKEFVRLFWPQVEPGSPFVDGIHVDAICTHIEDVKNGLTRKLLTCMPPRHGKSLLFSVFFPAWYWLHQPSHRFLCSSYSLQLSIRDSIKCRRLIESPLYQKCYGAIYSLTSDENRKQKFENDQGGYRLSTSVESANVGEGADTLLVDDPNNISEISSEAERSKVVGWWKNIMSTRMNNAATGVRLVVMQRCHEYDLAGYILSHDKDGDWCRLILPLEYQGSKGYTKVGWHDPRTTAGQLLSSRIPEEEIRFLKASLGGSGFSAQYNQAPAPATGDIFKQAWFRYYEDQGENYRLGDKLIAKAACTRFATVDLAISTKTTADYTVFGIFDAAPSGEVLLVYLYRARIEGVKIIPALRAVNEQYRPRYWGIEKVGFQDLIVQQARQEGLCVRGLKADTDKITRSIPLQVKMEAAQVWFPKDKAWVGDVELELLKFGPNCTHDDIVDVLAYAAAECQRRYRPRKEAPKPKPKSREEIMFHAIHDDLFTRDGIVNASSKFIPLDNRR